ncbi:MAG: DUF1934 domain-containing protein [Clostridia bacterium]|nr:DUF1934 domain-containing protein [Clostridia bacterium]
MKDVLVKVKTLQSGENTDGDTIELTAEGKFAEKDGAFLIKYSDAFISGDNEPIQTTVKVGSDGAVSVTRSGSYQSRFIIEKGKRCNCLYQTPYGTMTMGFYGEKIENKLNKNGGELSLLYTVDINGAELNRNQMTISVKEV